MSTASTIKPKKSRRKAPDVATAEAVEAVPTEVSPSPRKKQVEPYFRVYVMQDGAMKQFTDPIEACEFVSEYDTVISSMESFPNRAQMLAFLKSGPTKASTPVKPGQVITLDEMSPEDKSKFNRIRTLMEDAKPKNTIAMDWKCTKKAEQFAVVFRPLNDQGLPQWSLKPPFQRVITSYFKECPSDLKHVNEFFENLKLAPQRDPDQGPDCIKMSKAKNSDKEYKTFVMCSLITIPIEKFTSAVEEEEWIKGCLHNVFNEIRAAQRTNLFMKIVKAAYSPKMYAAMMSDKAYGGTFTDYVQGAKIKCTRLENLNKFITKDEANDIKMTLMTSEREHKKYPNDDLYSDQKHYATIKTEPGTMSATPTKCKPQNTEKKSTPKKRAATKPKASSPKKKRQSSKTKKEEKTSQSDDENITDPEEEDQKPAAVKHLDTEPVVHVEVLQDDDETDDEPEMS